MKKMLTFFVAIVSFSTLFAQHGSCCETHCHDKDNKAHKQKGYEKPKHNNGRFGDNRNDDRVYRDSRYDDGRNNNKRPVRAVVMRGGNDGSVARNGNHNDAARREEMDRMNCDYDRRIYDYRNNKRMSTADRDKEVDRLKKEKNAKIKSIAGGALSGGVLGVLLGTR